ncbi:MAG: sigma-54 dependent transcriptional regulator [Desulfococcaceae bacterium]|jgi:transcriptional regulator with PAS, ATPase and Fis domain|nr:sigma-54 dependent transcriptional regulator [Desulfococcaceae bacterium]
MLKTAVQQAVPDELEEAEYECFRDIIGMSRPMMEIFGITKKIAATDSTVMITGESGTGKGLIAKAIHRNSRRKDSAFVALNCAVIPESLIESQLFGHARGSFTGATSSKTGKFEEADQGTIFLDEIAELKPEMQVKLLRALEEREIEPIGGKKRRINVRIIAATNKNIQQEVRKGNFREDLYYRLYVIPVKMPPLRDREKDIELLTEHYIKYFNHKENCAVSGFSAEALQIMLDYSWPGNVRELKNIVERLTVIKQKGRIERHDLPFEMMPDCHCGICAVYENGIFSEKGICLQTAVSEYEKMLILKSLERAQGIKKRAAELLQLKRTTLVEKMKRYRL